MVTVGSVLYYLVSLDLTPHHEGVHGSLHMMNSIPLELRGVRVGGGGGRVDVVTGETESHGCGLVTAAFIFQLSTEYRLWDCSAAVATAETMRAALKVELTGRLYCCPAQSRVQLGCAATPQK